MKESRTAAQLFEEADNYARKKFEEFEKRKLPSTSNWKTRSIRNSETWRLDMPSRWRRANQPAKMFTIWACSTTWRAISIARWR